MARHYKVGRAYSVRLDGHNEPAQMRSIEVDGMNAGGGIMLLANRGDGEIDRIVSLLNEAESGKCLSVQEAWEAAGGNPGIKPSKVDLLDALRMLDKVCDEAD